MKKQETTKQPPPQPLYSCGAELFPDGASLHLLRAGHLCLATKDKNDFGKRITINDQTFAATPLSSAFESALRLPEKTADHGSTAELHARLSVGFQGLAGQERSAADLLATYVLSTHLRPAIVAPMLNLWGVGAAGSPLVQLMSALCRHPLPVTDLRFKELLSLPHGLEPTVILPDAGESLLRRLQTSAGAARFATLHRGELTHVRCGVVACSLRPLSLESLPVALTQSQSSWTPIAPSLLDALAEEYQPLLLDFRARCWQQAAASTFDIPEFCAPTRAWARSLGAALSQAPDLQRSLVVQLRGLDQQIRLDRSQSNAGVILEVLLHLVHNRVPAAYVYDVAETANTIVVGRYEKPELTPKAVGAVLRHQGFSKKRDSGGYQVILDRSASARVHQLCTEFGISSPDATGCAICRAHSDNQAA